MWTTFPPLQAMRTSIIPPFLYKKSRGNLLAAIRNLSGRDFEKKKQFIAGAYLQNDPEKLVGLAEVFDVKKRLPQATIGYCIREEYWHHDIAMHIVALLKSHLLETCCMDQLVAFVMPENVWSGRVLLRNGFVKEQWTEERYN